MSPQRKSNYLPPHLETAEFSKNFVTIVDKICPDILNFNLKKNVQSSMLGGVPVPTAWRVLGLRMEERPPAMEVSYEYIE
jgi:hypothetical protein